jgi:hypothetical protein
MSLEEETLEHLKNDENDVQFDLLKNAFRRSNS